MDQKFTHLHVHTEYSLLDGSAKIKEIIARTKELGMESVAITDHGVMFGVIDFYKEAVGNGIKPIIGCEVYVASGSRLNKESSKSNFYYHLVLLAMNNEGYNNLVKIVSSSFTEGFYYKPRIDTELLRQYKTGLIGLSACLGGPISRNLLNSTYEKALEQALMYDEILGRGNFYLEIQDHGLQEQKQINPQIIRMSAETGIPLVATNDSHYIYNSDAKAHEILLCIQTGKTMNDDDRMKYDGDQFYFKSQQEMYSLFPYAREACENTQKIAERCNVSFVFNEYKLPVFQLPENMTDSYEYLRMLSINGLKERYGDKWENCMDRLEKELDIIRSMGFVDYFLITWDFIRYARDNNIPVGFRGSAAGSIVCYSLRIINVDPLKYNLIFERFLNPERISMPDIDIDFCYERRQEVIDYVNNKYGADHVAQIITFGTMSAKSVIRDVGRALGMPYADVDRIAKMVPFELKITIQRALDINPEFSKAYEEEEDTKYLIDMSMRLEGLPRHASTHAAGVVITDKPVYEYVPLNQNDGVITTQYPMGTLEELGLLKMDFLGLRTLTVIQSVVDEVKRNYGTVINIYDIDYTDKKVFDLISSGKTEGVFQVESSGMASFMRELKPDSLEDIIAGISLYRPGPMDSIPKYINNKNNPQSIEYTHELLSPILNTTYGCIVYQEQVMQIVRDLAGYSYGRSDLIRKAMSKKKADVMAQERINFVNGLGDTVPGCIKNGVPKEAAEKIFDDMVDFARYAFNKSHAAAYAFICFQTAWLKNYYPVEFMAALISSVMDFTEKVAQYIEECKKMGIKLLPPDINESYGRFSVSGGSIRFGLSAIKNVGRAVIEAIINERESGGNFKNLTDFISRMDSQHGNGAAKTAALNKRCLESLIKAGAFDSMGGRRSQYMAVYKNVMDGITKTKKTNIDGQMSLFDISGGDESGVSRDDLPNLNEYGQREMLNYEKEVLGVYVSGHPLSQYESIISNHINVTSADFVYSEEDITSNMPDGRQVSVGGIIAAKSIKYTKNGNKPMAFLTIEDMYGSVEVIVFTQIYEKYSDRLIEDTVVVVSGRASVREEENGKIICNDIKFFNDLVDETKTLWIKIHKHSNISPDVVTNILSSYRGRTPVIIYDEKKKQKLRANEEYWVKPEETLIENLRNYLGEEAVVLR